MYWIHNRHMDNPRDPRESCSRAYELPIQGVHCHKNQHFHGEDKHKPVAIASLRWAWKVFLDVIPRRVRPFGAEGGLTRIGWGWVGGWVRAQSVTHSSKPACCCLPCLGSEGAKQDPAGYRVLQAIWSLTNAGPEWDMALLCRHIYWSRKYPNRLRIWSNHSLLILVTSDSGWHHPLKLSQWAHNEWGNAQVFWIQIFWSILELISFTSEVSSAKNTEVLIISFSTSLCVSILVFASKIIWV